MRKVLFYIAAALIIVGAGIGVYLSVTDNSKVKVITMPPADEVNVEECISLDNQYMFNYYSMVDSCKYKWFESCILMNNYLDSLDTKVAGVSNVYQVQKKKALGGTTVTVLCIAHTVKGTEIKIKKNAFWVEDFNLLDYEINVKFNDALDSLANSKYSMPHSKYCVLRAAVGPIPNVNPQYIFGNKFDHYYVDAGNGNVTDTDPTGLPEDETKEYPIIYEDVE